MDVRATTYSILHTYSLDKNADFLLCSQHRNNEVILDLNCLNMFNEEQMQKKEREKKI